MCIDSRVCVCDQLTRKLNCKSWRQSSATSLAVSAFKSQGIVSPCVCDVAWPHVRQFLHVSRSSSACEQNSGLFTKLASLSAAVLKARCGPSLVLVVYEASLLSRCSWTVDKAYMSVNMHAMHASIFNVRINRIMSVNKMMSIHSA